jgi:hypothetical protein
MTKLSLKPSKLYRLNPCRVIWSGNDERKSQNFMRTSSNSTNRRSRTSANLSNKEKHPSTMMLQDQCTTMTATNATTLSMSTTSIPMVAGLWKTGKRIMGHLLKKEAR